jgi:hypothetical protein
MAEAETVAPATETPPVAPVTPAAPSTTPVAETSLIGTAEVAKPVEAGQAAEAKAVPAEGFDPTKFTPPEGFTVDPERMTAFAETLNAADLSPQDRGSKLIELGNKMVEDAVKKVGEANTKAWTDTIGQWEKEIKADATLGGDKLQPALQTIAKAIDRLGPERATAFKQAMTITGAGSNPAIVRGMYELSKLVTEGGHVPGNPGGGKEKSINSMFFPNSPEMKD